MFGLIEEKAYYSKGASTRGVILRGFIQVVILIFVVDIYKRINTDITCKILSYLRN